jgi:hypothetical protein
MKHGFRYRVIFVIGLVILFQSGVDRAYARFADDAVVLPEGTWRLLFDSEFYSDFDKRYDQDGNVEPLGTDLNKNLNSQVIPGLAAVETAFGMPTGSATVGNSVVPYKRNLQQYFFQPAYGLTDRFSIGVIVPYLHIRNVISPAAALNTSGATVGKSVIGSGFGAPLAPFGSFPDVIPLTANDIQNYLGGGLTVGGVTIPGLGFKPVETWDGEGIGDIQVGGRYQYFSSDYFRTSFTGGIQLPTGQVDDPNNLVDTGLGTGAYALLFRFNQDLMYQPDGIGKRLGFPEPWTGFINTTFYYDVYLPNTQKLRVCSPNSPACPTSHLVDQNLGDRFQAEISAKVGLFANGIIFTPMYSFAHKFKDHDSGSGGLDYSVLEINTQQTEQIYILGLTYSTIPLYAQKRFAFPLSATISYRNRFAGENVVKSHYYGLTISAYF